MDQDSELSLCYAIFLLFRVNTEVQFERRIGRLQLLNISQCSLQRSFLVVAPSLAIGVCEGTILKKA